MSHTHASSWSKCAQAETHFFSFASLIPSYILHLRQRDLVFLCVSTRVPACIYLCVWVGLTSNSGDGPGSWALSLSLSLSLSLCLSVCLPARSVYVLCSYTRTDTPQACKKYEFLKTSQPPRQYRPRGNTEKLCTASPPLSLIHFFSYRPTSWPAPSVKIQHCAEAWRGRQKREDTEREEMKWGRKRRER